MEVLTIDAADLRRGLSVVAAVGSVAGAGPGSVLALHPSSDRPSAAVQARRVVDALRVAIEDLAAVDVSELDVAGHREWLVGIERGRRMLEAASVRGTNRGSHRRTDLTVGPT